VPKYKHMMAEVFGLSAAELAVMCVLMLRGHQTTGELRGRTDRLYTFSSLQEVEETLDALSAKEPEPLVVKLPRQPGQKEVRYAHLLSGEVSAEQFSVPEHAEAEAPPPVVARSDRLAALEQEVAALRREFEEFKKQFD
jgi:uncharacterized protein YceH (UPF0502 family)